MIYNCLVGPYDIQLSGRAVQYTTVWLGHTIYSCLVEQYDIQLSLSSSRQTSYEMRWCEMKHQGQVLNRMAYTTSAVFSGFLLLFSFICFLFYSIVIIPRFALLVNFSPLAEMYFTYCITIYIVLQTTGMYTIFMSNVSKAVFLTAAQIAQVVQPMQCKSGRQFVQSEQL